MAQQTISVIQQAISMRNDFDTVFPAQIHLGLHTFVFFLCKLMFFNELSIAFHIFCFFLMLVFTFFDVF